MVRSPGLEVDIELAAPAPLALGRCVGDDDLDRAIDDLVSNAALAVQKVVPWIGVKSWVGKASAHGEEFRLASSCAPNPHAYM